MRNVFFYLHGNDDGCRELCISFLSVLQVPADTRLIIPEADEPVSVGADDLVIHLSVRAFVVCPAMLSELPELFHSHPETDAIGVMGSRDVSSGTPLKSIRECPVGRLFFSHGGNTEAFSGRGDAAPDDALIEVTALHELFVAIRGRCLQAVSGKTDGLRTAVALPRKMPWVYLLGEPDADQEVFSGIASILKAEQTAGQNTFFRSGTGPASYRSLYLSLLSPVLFCSFDDLSDTPDVIIDTIEDGTVTDTAWSVLFARHTPHPSETLERLIRHIDDRIDTGSLWKFSRIMTGYRNITVAGSELETLCRENRLSFQHLYRYRYSVPGHLFTKDREQDPENKRYNRLFEQICDCTVRHIQTLPQVNVVFFAISASEWMMDALYRKLDQSGRFVPYVAVIPMFKNQPSARDRLYRKTCAFFHGRGYRVLETMDADGNVKGYEGLGVRVDVAIHMTQSYSELPDTLHLIRLPLTVLNLYAVYAILIPGGRFAREVGFDYFNLHMQWRIFSDSAVNAKQYTETGHIPSRNVVMSGFFKMDYFYESREIDADAFWKIPGGKDAGNIMKLIWSPHHSIGQQIFSSATIQHNLHFMYELACKYADRISWIVKPHPALPARALASGLFPDMDAYDAYVAKWNALPNAKWEEEIDYLPVFATSDGIINDSCSFVAEYMYTGKPMCFLENGEDVFGTLGHLLQEGLYRVDGRDHAAIERFVTDVILEKKDPLRETRERLFNEYLDYVSINGKTATEKAWEVLASL